MVMRLLVRATLLGGAALAQQYPGFSISSLDRSVDPCTDFYKFSCGSWMSTNPLPADQARWGRFDAPQDRNRLILENTLESVSPIKAGRTPIEQKIGDFYYACMDEKAIDS